MVLDRVVQVIDGRTARAPSYTWKSSPKIVMHFVLSHRAMLILNSVTLLNGQHAFKNSSREGQSHNFICTGTFLANVVQMGDFGHAVLIGDLVDDAAVTENRQKGTPGFFAPVRIPHPVNQYILMPSTGTI